MKKLLLEGGVGGHLNHLYDNRQMTYNKMVSILKKASNGELVGTEKADGYNIFLGYQGGLARAARNKTDMQRGGMTMQELAVREFKGGEKVRQAYIQSFDAYQAALDSLSDREKIKIFGPNGEVFYNTEIMGPAAAQVLNYDVNVLSIHHGGHKTYNRATDTVDVIDATENSRTLDRIIDRFEAATAGKSFAVQRTAFVKLEALDGDADLNVAIAKLQKAGFAGTMTIEEYLEIKLVPVVDAALPYFDRRIKQEIIDRMLNKENKKGVTQITKGFPKQQKQLVSALVKQSGKLIKDAIWPIEEAVHDFAVEMLRGMESAYILNNEKELGRLRHEVSTAIRDIQAYSGPGEEAAKDVLLQQLKKLKKLEDVSSTAEGFVFEEDGMLYKFTGNYAPMNQLLGMFKYGRGKVPAIKKQELTEHDESEEEEPPLEPFTSPNSPEEIVANDAQILDNIAVFPGGFKPPHKGHFEAAAYLSNQRGVDQVYVIISPKARAEHDFDSMIEVTAEQSKELWDLYVAANRDKIGAPIITMVGKTVTPVTDAYEFMKKMNPGQTVTFAKGSKDREDKRFNGAQAWSDKKGFGLTVRLINTPVFGKGISGTMMRKHVAKEDWKSFIENTPLTKDIDKLRAWQIVTGKIQPTPQAGPALEETLFRMVESALDEKAKTTVGAEIESQKNKGKSEAQAKAIALSKKERGEIKEEEIEEMSAMGAGAVAGPGAALKKKKSLIREEDPTIEEIMNYLLNDLGVVTNAN